MASAARVDAQETRSPGDEARLHLGPLALTPSITVTSVGIDDNVFNDFENPKRDTTAAVGPAMNFWLRAGRSRLSGKASSQYLYFKDFENQRGWNSSNEGKWEVPFARITPFATGSYTNTRERPGFEIDARVRQLARSAGIGIGLRLSGKTEVVVDAKRTQLKFDERATFLGESLAHALNRKSDSAGVEWRYALTPLTTFVLRTEGRKDRFTFDPLRNADSVSVMPGFELKPVALISGTVAVGYKRFTTLDASVPDYQGLVASVAAKYVLSATKFELRVARDLAYSFEPSEPYYALTDTGLTVTQRVTRRWDGVGRIGWQLLGYRAVAPGSQGSTGSTGSNGSTTLLSERADHGRLYGAGIGYRIAPLLRVGFDANYTRRESGALIFRDYSGLRLGASMSYGLPQ